ncbi:MAG: hypothetical protein WBJ62_08035 [Coriobacteriia bacterium]
MSDAVLVVGSGATVDEALAATTDAQLLISYDWRLGVDLRARTGLPVKIVDITGRIAPIEERAWAWTVSLVEDLRSDGSIRPDVLTAARRALFLEVLMPVSLARERAERVRSIAPGAHIDGIGLTDVERSELGFAPLVASAPVQPEAPRRSLYRRLRSRAGAILARQREARARAEELRELRARSSAEIERARQALATRGDSPVAVVLVAVDVHVHLFRSTISSLRDRGWSVLLLSFSSQRDFVDVAPALGVTALRLGPMLDAQEEPDLDARIGDRICRWAESAVGGVEATVIAQAARAQIARIARLMGAYSEFLSTVRPNVILTASEINPPVETMASAGRTYGIPTVNVQHGAITDLPRFSDFRFDAFCVFGEAYAEVLTRRGVPADRLHVTGSPLADRSAMGDVADGAVQAESHHPDRSESRFSLLFAGGYSCATVSDAALHDTLAMVLEAAGRDGSLDVQVKLHPLGGGSEAGYEGALAEYPDVPVTVTRDAELDGLMRACDCVVTHGSTVGIDAALYHKPVILLSLPGDEDLLPLVAEGVALRASTSEDVLRRVAEIRRGARASDADYERIRRRYTFRQDGEAGERVADVCETLAGHRRPGRCDSRSGGDGYDV